MAETREVRELKRLRREVCLYRSSLRRIILATERMCLEDEEAFDAIREDALAALRAATAARRNHA